MVSQAGRPVAVNELASASITLVGVMVSAAVSFTLGGAGVDQRRRRSVIHRQGDGVAGGHERPVRGAGRKRIDAVGIQGRVPVMTPVLTLMVSQAGRPVAVNDPASASITLVGVIVNAVFSLTLCVLG